MSVEKTALIKYAGDRNSDSSGVVVVTQII